MTTPTLLAVNNYYYNRGGAEVVFMNHSRLFEQAGGTVVPFSMKHALNFPSPWQDHFVEELEFGENYSLVEKFRRLPKVIYSFESRNKLQNLLQHCKPAVCHIHNLYHHISPSILSILHKKHIPTLITLHDLKLACPAYNMLAIDGVCERCKGGKQFNVVRNRCIKGSYALSSIIYLEAKLHSFLKTYERYVDRFLVPSQFYIEKLSEWGISRKKMIYLPNFVELPGRGASKSTGKFVYVGRLSREKGVSTLIRSAAAAMVPLQIIGTGPDIESLKLLAKQLGADAEFSGFLTGEELSTQVGSARVCVLPSECYENAPLSILEAYAQSTPVIGANIGGIPEMIQEGITGITFESGNVSDLAEKLKQMKEMSPEQCLEMGQAGYSLVANKFTSLQYMKKIFSIYSDLGVDMSKMDINLS